MPLPLYKQSNMRFSTENSRKASIFDYGQSNQSSYPLKSFCFAALKSLRQYALYEQEVTVADRIVAAETNPKTISTKLIIHFDITKEGEVSSCDILFTEDIEVFSRQYMEHTLGVAESCTDRDLSDECMVIGTSVIIDTEIDGAVGMNSGIYNNPFMIWGRYRKRWFRYELPISFQFHHTQMDGAHAGKFLSNLQEEINRLYK